MRRLGRWPIAFAWGLLVPATAAHAVIYGGAGGARADCLAVFDADVNFPAKRPREIRCADGDACDLDGTVNGSCQFSVAMCANSTFNPGQCTLAGVDEIVVDHAEDNGDPRFDPYFQGLQARIDNQIEPPTSDPDVCTSGATIQVPIKGPLANGRCKRGKKKLVVTTESLFIDGRRYRDRDKLRLTCDPPPACSPQTVFTGTFDRIQRQVFNPSCAIGGCHDSQSQTGGLLLEEGTAYGSLVDVTPVNVAAQGLGWLRVDGTGADPANSLLLHKLTGDLGDGLGERMPFGRRKLDRYLIDLIELWIAGSAPETGWVPGTD